MDWLFAAGETPAEAFFDPSFWVNLGLGGVFLFFFIMNKIHSHPELERVERGNEKALDELRKQHEAAIRSQKESHEAAMERMDDHVRALILERDKANAERNEALTIIRDFSIAAGAVFGNQPPKWDPRRKGESGDH